MHLASDLSHGSSALSKRVRRLPLVATELGDPGELLMRGIFRLSSFMAADDNLYGDIELDAHGMRALAHPTRLAILLRLQRHGPDTATGLSAHVGVSPSVASWHLRHLGEHGLVKDAARQGPGRQRWWEAVSGFRFTAVDDDSADAARALTGVLEQLDGDIPGRWRAEVEPHLEPGWRRLSGRASTLVAVTPAELESIGLAIEKLLAPYVLRRQEAADDWPSDTRNVRILRYTMPELESETDSP